MKPAAPVPILLMLVPALACCGAAKKHSAAVPERGGRSNLINTPALKQLSEDQLRGLAARCGRFEAAGEARGPYSAKYCDDALAAWSDSPLHMLVIPPAHPK